VVAPHGDQLADVDLLRGEEVRIGEMFHRVLPADGLVPYKDAGFVAEIEEARILRVVAAPHEITAQIAQLLHIGDQQRIGQRAAELRVCFVSIDAQQAHRLIVDANLLPHHTHLPDTKPLVQIVAGCIVRTKADVQRVQMWRIRLPERRIG
jgi:hypothetical protein